MSLRADVRLVRGGLVIDASLEIMSRELSVLCGPNGAGKTTMLRCLAGLDRIDQGEIRFGDEIWDDGGGVFVAPRLRRVGMVFQSLALFPTMTACDNVAFRLRAQRIRRSDARRLADDHLAALDLAHLADRLPHELSRGEQQRVALARALIGRPALVLLDEPLASLDVTARNEMRRWIMRHFRQVDGIRIVVTHDPVDALGLADRVLVMEEGSITHEGPVERLAAQPRSRYVADLVGLNMLAGTATGDTIVLEGGGTLAAGFEAEAGPVLATFHPRAVAVHIDRPTGSPRNVWRMTITHVELLNETVRLVAKGSFTCVAEITRSSFAQLAISPGGEVWLSVKATEVSVYPR